MSLRLYLKSLIIPFQAISQALPQTGTIMDIGCGNGEVASFLARLSTRQVIGIDPDKLRLQATASTQQNLKLVHADALTYKFPLLAGAVLSDMLHHLSPQQQRLLLTKTIAALQPGGVIIVKEIDRTDMIRSRLSRLWDWLFYPQDKIAYFSTLALTRLLTALHLTVTHINANTWVPASIHLYIGVKHA